MGTTINFGSGLAPGGALPQTDTAEAQRGVDLITSLLNQQKDVQTQLLSTVGQAVTPIAGRQAATPNLGATPLPLNPSGAQLTQPTYSRSAARDKGIANIVLGAASAIGKVQQYESQKEQKNLAIHLENVLKYTDGMNQAQQALKQDPNNADAKQVLQQNQDNLNALLADKKLRKQVGKAFDINFTDPSQNDQPEHKAAAQAIKSYSEQLMQKMPAQLQPNVTAQQKVQVLQAQQNAIDAQIKATIPIVTRQLADQSAMERTQVTAGAGIQKERETQAAEAQRQHEHERQQNLRTRAQITAANSRAITVAKMNNDGRMAVELSRQQGEVIKTFENAWTKNQFADSLGDNDPKKQAMYRSNLNALNAQSLRSQQKILNYKTLMAAAKTTPEQKAKYQAGIDFENSIQEQTQNQIEDLDTKLNTGGSNNGQSGKSASSTTNSSSAVTTVGPEDDSSVDEDDEDDSIIDR